jgi:hypothetical protein
MCVKVDCKYHSGTAAPCGCCIWQSKSDFYELPTSPAPDWKALCLAELKAGRSVRVWFKGFTEPILFVDELNLFCCMTNARAILRAERVNCNRSTDGKPFNRKMLKDGDKFVIMSRNLTDDCRGEYMWPLLNTTLGEQVVIVSHTPTPRKVIGYRVADNILPGDMRAEAYCGCGLVERVYEGEK